MKDLIIYGAGGLGREVACLIMAINSIEPTWRVLGFIDDNIAVGSGNRYGKVLGNKELLQQHGAPMAVAIAIADPVARKRIVASVTNANIYWPNLISPSAAFLDPAAVAIGEGNIVFGGCRISCEVSIGDFNFLNGSVVLGHDVALGNFNCLMPAVRIAGEVEIGDSNFFGVNAAVLQGVRIGARTRVGAGSVVFRHTRDDALYHGNPARRVLGI